ncbi:MAG TPA: hypothetical protein VN730_09220 [Steroidobacteraceae bacterium]|nr:hypothetical protein [Steroidobacteraceae bacterium]
MNATYVENRSTDTAAFGGMLDAAGGIATVALAIIALAGLVPEVLMAIATIVFGVTLILQAGALVSELSGISSSPTAVAATAASDSLSGGGVGMMFMVGVAGIVLGILALLGITPLVLCAAALIAFGAALMLGSGSVRSVHQLQAAVRRAGTVSATTQTNELLANEMAAGSAGAQLLSGIAAIVLGILALSGVYSMPLVLVGLLVVGASNILAGGALSGIMFGSSHREQTTTATIR